MSDISAELASQPANGRPGPQDGHVRTGDGAQARPILQARHPRHDRAVVEARDELRSHDDRAAPAHDEAHEVGSHA